MEYVGERKWVEDTLSRGMVPMNGTKVLGDGNVIKSAVIDQFPEVLDKE
jgi:hypothetical protein